MKIIQHQHEPDRARAQRGGQPRRGAAQHRHTRACHVGDQVRAALSTIVEGGTLSMDQAAAAMGAVMDGEATPSQLAAGSPLSVGVAVGLLV